MKGKSFELFNNEVPHLFVKSLEKQKAIYFAPSHPMYNQKILKQPILYTRTIMVLFAK